ncbi:AbiH family protein [Collinsella sp. AM34-10]|uniref:AbiH family protein n=1 Tax=Collinsella sp. AM34-10 TaxID=2292316 RepID=UPI001314816C|nr:AbiH family protein [Collinsella sp. AM34-10]
MFKILWIIGNGFDINLGLNTGYRSFLLNKYFADGTSNKYRDELVGRLGDFDPGSQSNLWSDLELLLGETTKLYEDDVELFHETFEDIQQQLLEYVAQESQRLPDVFPPATITEFKDSLCLFSRRLAPLDRVDAISELAPLDNAWVSAISLNYTRAFDSFWNAACQNGRLHLQMLGDEVNYYYEDRLLHLHGGVDDLGNGASPVFGVSDHSQISSVPLSNDADFTELWIKSQRNAGILRNNNTQDMADLVSSANLICIYGCSLGRSDAYIWKEVGKNIVSSVTPLYIFDYELPDRRSGSYRRFQKQRQMLIDTFLSVAEIKGSDKELAVKRIVPVESSRLFRFGSRLKLDE